MNDQGRTNPEQIEELSTLRNRIQELEQQESERKRAEQEMVILAEIGRMISSTLDIDEVYERFAAERSTDLPGRGYREPSFPVEKAEHLY